MELLDPIVFEIIDLIVCLQKELSIGNDISKFWVICQKKNKVLLNCLKSLALKILSTIDVMIDLIALFEKICLQEPMFSSNWDACQNLTCWLKYDITLCMSATLSHFMGCQQFRWPTNDPYRGNSWISTMSWLNICSSNAIMGKIIGILMGLRCKQRMQYSSDR